MHVEYFALIALIGFKHSLSLLLILLEGAEISFVARETAEVCSRGWDGRGLSGEYKNRGVHQ